VANPVLTSAATVACSFQGSVTITNSGTVKLTVAGSPVAVSSGVSGWSVSGCNATTPNGTKAPCSKVATPTGGVSTKLTVGGSAVLLKTLAAPISGSAVVHTVSVTKVASTKLTAA
jgi:hypothetical protein